MGITLKIYRTTDSFLYFPTYVAEEEGIFETLLKSYNVDKVVFYPNSSEKSKRRGDLDPIKEMLTANKNIDKSFAIAICDPVVFLSKISPIIEYEKIKVIGAIINKLPFWAVNHQTDPYDTVEDLAKSNANRFKDIIHYNDYLVAGHRLGLETMQILQSSCHELNATKVNFGEEFEKVIDNENAIAITADIASLANALVDGKIHINYHYSDYKKNGYLTTGIVTTQNVCVKYEEPLTKIIEAIQKSILMIYSSNKVAHKICDSVMQRPAFDVNSAILSADPTKRIAIIDQIINLINRDKFYPADLNISKKCWNEAVDVFIRSEQTWKNHEMKHVLANSFKAHVDNRFVFKSERSLARQLGITLATFGPKEISSKVFAFFRNIVWKLRVFLWIIMVCSLIIAIGLYFKCDYPIIHFFEQLIESKAWNFILPVISFIGLSGFSTFFRGRKKE